MTRYSFERVGTWSDSGEFMAYLPPAMSQQFLEYETKKYGSSAISWTHFYDEERLDGNDILDDYMDFMESQEKSPRVGYMWFDGDTGITILKIQPSGEQTPMKAPKPCSGCPKPECPGYVRIEDEEWVYFSIPQRHDKVVGESTVPALARALVCDPDMLQWLDSRYGRVLYRIRPWAIPDTPNIPKILTDQGYENVRFEGSDRLPAPTPMLAPQAGTEDEEKGAPEANRYVIQLTDRSFCKNCGKAVWLLIFNEAETGDFNLDRNPMFYICFECNTVARAGVGPVPVVTVSDTGEFTPVGDPGKFPPGYVLNMEKPGSHCGKTGKPISELIPTNPLKTPHSFMICFDCKSVFEEGVSPSGGMLPVLDIKGKPLPNCLRRMTPMLAPYPKPKPGVGPYKDKDWKIIRDPRFIPKWAKEQHEGKVGYEHYERGQIANDRVKCPRCGFVWLTPAVWLWFRQPGLGPEAHKYFRFPACEKCGTNIDGIPNTLLEELVPSIKTPMKAPELVCPECGNRKCTEIEDEKDDVCCLCGNHDVPCRGCLYQLSIMPRRPLDKSLERDYQCRNRGCHNPYCENVDDKQGECCVCLDVSYHCAGCRQWLMSRTIRRKTPMMAPEKGRWGETEPILTLDQLPKWAREHPFVLNDPDKYKRLRFQKRLVVIHCDGCGKDSFIEMYRVVTPEKATDMNPSSTFTYLLPGDKRTCPRCGSREIPTLDFVFSEGASPKVTPMKAPRPDPKDPLLLSHPGFLVPPIVSFCENCNNWEHVYPMPAAHMALYTCLKCRATWDEVKEEEKQRKFGPPPKGIVVTCQHCRPKSPMAAPLGITGLSVFAIAGLLVSLPLIVWRLNSKEVA